MPKNTKKRIYLDYAAATPLDPKVYAAMRPYIFNNFGNASALYREASIAKRALESARKEVAAGLKALPKNIIFTSGGTEANNLAILGVALGAQKFNKPEVIVSSIEHHSVLDVANYLEDVGTVVTKMRVDKDGLLSADEIIKAITPKTVIVSIMFANNEIGGVQRIADIGRAILQYRKQNKSIYPLFHVDACQAAGLYDLDVNKLHVDLMTINAAKIYGPKGVGALYVRTGTPLQPIMFGGGQEQGLRPGTENVAGAVGLAEALKFAVLDRERNFKNLQKIQNYFYNKILKDVPAAKLNGPALGERRLPNNLNFLFPGVDGETLVLYLDARGVSAATGSACATGEQGGSHVLAAIGLSQQDANSSVRFTFGKATSKANVDFAVMAIKDSLKLLKLPV